MKDTRWQRCDIKAITLLANVLLRQQAVDQEAAEAILIRDGKVTEGAASNVFVVMKGVLKTPPKGIEMLSGITRELVLELAGDLGLEAREVGLTPEDISSSDEIWVTSSTREVLPVIELDGKPVGTGRPGPVWHRIHTAYQDYKRASNPDHSQTLSA